MTTATAPLCPKHQTPMRPSQYDEGGFYCPKDDPATEKGKCVEKVRGTGKKPASATVQTTALTAPAPPPSMPAWLAEPLREYIGNPAFDLLLPSVPVNASLGYGHQVAVSVVTISADPAEKEVFKVGTREGRDVFAYSKQGLEKFAEAAGIQVKTTRVDDRRDPGYCEFQALGAMKSSNGQSIIRTATKAFNMPDVEGEALRNRVARFPNEGEDASRRAVAAEMMAFRKHLIARTESGAVLRVFRALLAIKSGLTAEQISRPKVLARVEFNPDPKGNPVVERYLLEKGFAATTSLFGPSTPSVGADVRDVTEDDDEAEAETAEAEAGYPQEALRIGNAPTTEDPAAQALLDDISKAAEVLAWPEAMVETLIQKHGGDLAKARAEIVRYVDGAK